MVPYDVVLVCGEIGHEYKLQILRNYISDFIKYRELKILVLLHGMILMALKMELKLFGSANA